MSHVLILEKYVMLRDSSVRKMDGFLLMMKIYLDSVRYVFLVRPLGIFSLGNRMLEVYLDTLTRTQQLRLLSINSTGQA